MIDIFYNENCLDTMARIKEPIIDLVVTSPPYDNLRDYKGYSFDFESIAKELFRVINPGGVVVWVVGDAVINGSETGTSFKQALFFKEIGFNIHDTMIYEKNTASMPSGKKSNRYTQIFEYMFIFSKGKPKTSNLFFDKPNRWAGWKTWGTATKRQADGTNKDSGLGEKAINDFGARENIWGYVCSGGFGQTDEIAYQHPATFPEKLAEDHILTWSNKDDLVYDPFLGSGTTAIMAVKNKRHYLGSEISKEYFKLIQKRFERMVIIDNKVFGNGEVAIVDAKKIKYVDKSKEEVKKRPTPKEIAEKTPDNPFFKGDI
jgi:site-specific DNA-methyltransferase (adenine-specific)